MAVEIVRHNPDGGVDVVHRDAGHTGTVAVADVRFGRNADGSTNPDWVELRCPVAGCGAVSVHPIGGGCQPGEVQKLFVRLYLRRAAVLGIPVGQRSFAAIKARVRARVEAMDGPTRWRLEAMASEDDPVEP